MAFGGIWSVWWHNRIGKTVTDFLEKGAVHISVFQTVWLAAEFAVGTISFSRMVERILSILCTSQCTSQEALMFRWLLSVEIFGKFGIHVIQSAHGGSLHRNLG